MALQYALLGLLAEQPASGYELAKAFEGDLGRYAWQAGHNRIYPELARLVDEGLVERAEEGARGRRVHTLTAAGLEELRAWLRQPWEGSTVRNEGVLRLFLLSALDPGDARKILHEVAARCEEELAPLRDIVSGETPISPEGRLELGWLAAGYGLRQYEASRDWAVWALGELDKVDHGGMKASG
ncbi:PadR family transcriptional regulator [Nonomuraea ferruginea]|uniref:PadR family transcriptional regulator n=1 Tax=Nonomuraea ferruginea TaxID=46174 RepID=A0ABT4STW4_9ACTN|nr:PadR family transcriptional regulator [Nonomuraea ferruginea]MDA0640704.1 PadR family transcriptional regulator [Nonomuraea ferruginea]